MRAVAGTVVIHGSSKGVGGLTVSAGEPRYTGAGWGAKGRAAAWLVLTAAAACGAQSPPPSAPTGESDEVDDLVTPEEADPTARVAAASASTRAPPMRRSGRILIAGHDDARYELVVPPGLSQLKAVAMQEGDDPRELAASGPVGVGPPTANGLSLDSIMVFSDPLGLGVDMGAVPAEARDRLVTLYGEGLRERIPAARDPQLTSIGPHTAIRIEFPRVEMRNRPARKGRHYLILDGVATVSVDCLWTSANAEQMSKACDAVAASLRRHSALSE